MRFEAHGHHESKFVAHVEITPTCWLWTGRLNADGYGVLSGKYGDIGAHRWAYAFYVEPIPDGMWIDHTCYVHPCVNLDHLRLLTPKQNRENRSAIVGPNNRSGHVGVSQNKRGKWQVSVRHNWRRYSGGVFEDVEEAGRAARRLRNELFTHNDIDREDLAR